MFLANRTKDKTIDITTILTYWLDLKEIKFEIENKGIEKWTFDTIQEAEETLLRINEQLNKLSLLISVKN
jgi:hypothetical protein